jgi:hypothetical protein
VPRVRKNLKVGIKIQKRYNLSQIISLCVCVCVDTVKILVSNL